MNLESLLATTLVAFGASAAPQASAAVLSMGIEGGADSGRVDCVTSFACDHRSTQAKIFLGYRYADAVDVQVLYIDAGHFKGGDTTSLDTPFGGTFKVGLFGLSAGYRWQFGQTWSAVARGGIAAVRTRFDYADGLAGSVSKTLAEPLGGLGIAYAVTPQWRLGIDYDVTQFKVHETRGLLHMVGISAEYQF